MRLTRLLISSAILLALGVSPSAASASEAYPGTYEGKATGVKAKVKVSNSLGGTLSYAIKTECGKSRGKIVLGKAKNGRFTGRRTRRGPESTLRTTAAKLRAVADGERLEGTVRESLSGGGGKLSGCHGKRRFVAELGKTDAFLPDRYAGHYSGSSQAGLPIAFDLVYDEHDDESRITNFTADVEAECYDQFDDEAEDRVMVVHIAGLEGRVDRDGEFYIDYAPDEDYEYEADGRLTAGSGRMDLAAVGVFDADGNPNPDGPFVCDSWGAIYEATLQP